MSVLHMSIPNDLTEIDEVNAAFDRFAAEQDLSDGIRRAMKMVFDELLNNAISYAFEDNDAHELSVEIEKHDDRLTVEIRDDGRPFDPFGVSEPDTAADIESRPLGGVGVHLVKSMMDHVDYERVGDENVLRLVKMLE